MFTVLENGGKQEKKKKNDQMDEFDYAGTVVLGIQWQSGLEFPSVSDMVVKYNAT